MRNSEAEGTSMAHGTRWGVIGLALAILFGSAASDGPRARAEGEAATSAPAAWVLDVRVVRVDALTRGTAETASPWEPSVVRDPGRAPWAELLEGLKSRGTTTLLCEQRVTVSDDGTANIRQLRKRPVEQSQSVGQLGWDHGIRRRRTPGRCLRRGVATWRRGVLRSMSFAEWEEGATTTGGVILGSSTWHSDYGQLPRDGETLVLPYRSQSLPDDKTSPTIEVYVLLTCARVDRK
jgi:hypothetical protein